MLYSYKGQKPIAWDEFPHRIRLSSGITKTDKTTFTQDDIIDSGWLIVDDSPLIENPHRYYAYWHSEFLIWQVLEYNFAEKVNEVNALKEKHLAIVDKNIAEYERSMRQGISSSLDFEQLKEYLNSLDRLSEQEGYPYYVVFPTPPQIKGISSHGCS